MATKIFLGMQVVLSTLLYWYSEACLRLEIFLEVTRVLESIRGLLEIVNQRYVHLHVVWSACRRVFQMHRFVCGSIDLTLPAKITRQFMINAVQESDRILQQKIGMPLWVGCMTFVLWLSLLVGSITLVNIGYDNEYLKIFEVMFRIGSITFGGAEVALPMLQNEAVPLGWVTDEQFFQGLGLAQSLPGPLFNFSSFLGATYKGVLGAIVAELGLFGPGYILIFAMVPFWGHVRHSTTFKAILKGVNATAIGLIGSGCVFLYARAVKTAADAMVFVLAGGLACFYSTPAPLVIFLGAVFGALFSPGLLDVGQVKYH